MFQPAQAWQPRFDAPLLPFQTSHLESWFEEFAAALDLNGIWIQEFMYEILEYHLPHDLKRRLTYFSWTPCPYNDMRDAVLKFYSIKHDTSPKVTQLHLAHHHPGQPVQTIPLPTITGQTGNGNQPFVPIDRSFQRPIAPESMTAAFGVSDMPPLSIMDSTLATAPRIVRCTAEICSAALSALSISMTSAAPAHSTAEPTPVPTRAEACETMPTMESEPAAVPHAISFPDRLVPAVETLVGCQPDLEFSYTSRGSQGVPDLLARIFSHLSEEPGHTPCPESTKQVQASVSDSHSALPHPLVKTGGAASRLCTVCDQWSVQNMHFTVARCTVVGTQAAATRDAWSGVDLGVRTKSTTIISNTPL
ncbi:hypothetical protein HPB51_017670 [Rhipicephalus microplus]|uniref:Uncharacterized protein n=1 Tax=Rhipicephalus microplus TaxID=6941 RepID=A0A9J6E3D0_RHIMP|nr:hypothetical protein HPB51_017670 [Rhipicephalus microplus]